jgi:hypothetical protein
MLCAAGIDPAHTALFFDKVSKTKTKTKTKGNVAELIPAYLSSHPASNGRAVYFRQACPKP